MIRRLISTIICKILLKTLNCRRLIQKQTPKTFCMKNKNKRVLNLTTNTLAYQIHLSLNKNQEIINSRKANLIKI